ncbi:hypothetical protein KFL_003610060 [Klebsormidium nitens]|uniref:Uncharacterized protein n=1 Tax=Klebsormidium nitens TaxID=105231 RepID=A0A1Y1IC68_KLENI|nr:hypothetical protein KFL_003610060 [Klebsormidium nitens]|eukprot:GAQ87562.1 hypothetical protein KFL_003610060 [Klebsormidium nitens]
MEFLKGAAEGMDVISMGVQACPFLRSIMKDTNVDLAKAPGGPSATKDRAQGQCPAQRGPIFCDEPNFESTLRLFHGSGGVVPLARFSEQLDKSEAPARAKDRACPRTQALDGPRTAQHPLAASAATISISAFGGGAPNPFSWDGFMAARNKRTQPEPAKSGRPEPAKSSRRLEASTGGREPASQSETLKTRAEIGIGPKPQQAKARAKPAKAVAAPEAPTQQHVHGEPVDAKEWLSTSNCPIAKMHRVIMELAPAATELFRNPQNIKLSCPAPIIAARVALSKTPPIRQLRPQPLEWKLLAVGGSTLAVNVPLGMWREHVEKFSPEWFVAVHAAVPFVAMLRKAVLIPKTAMVLTILAAILGQVIGSRGERYRLQQKAAAQRQMAASSPGGGTPFVRATAVQQPARVHADVRRAERMKAEGDLEAPAAGCVAGLGVFDLFSGRAEELGWTPSRVKGRGVSGKACRSSWKLPTANGLGLEGRSTWVH